MSHMNLIHKISHFQNYSLRNKIIAASLLVELISVGVIAYFGFTRASHIVTAVSGRFEESVQSLNEARLTSVVEIEAEKADQVFSSIQDNLIQIANYRASLYDRPVVSGDGKYWNARDELIQLGAGQYVSLHSDLATVFINNTIALNDQLIKELNVDAYLDLVAPNVLDKNPNILAVYYIDEIGVIRRYSKVDMANLSPEFDPQDGIFYSIATPENNPERKPSWTSPYQDPAGTGLMVSVSVPVYTTKDDFKGVMGMDMQLGRIAENIARVSIGNNGFAFLIDKSGHILAMPEEKYPLFGLQPENVPLNQSPSETVLGHGSDDFQAIARRMINGESGIAIVLIDGVENYIVYTPLTTPGYSLGVVAPVKELNAAIINSREEVQAETNSFLKISTLILIGLLIVTIFLSVNTSKIIAEPLLRLTHTAEKVTSGDLSARAVVKSRDETGTLANAFNGMTARLEETLAGLERSVADRTRDLEIAIHVSKQITQELRLDDLLPKLVEDTRAGFDLYFVAVYLYEANHRRLVLSAGTGEVGQQMMADRKVFDIDARPSIVAQAARNRQAAVIGDVSLSQVHLPNPYLPMTRSEAAIPMITQGELIGVLGLQSQRADRFEQEDLRILVSLAEQIGVAVKNARLYEEQLLVAEELKRVDQMKSHFLSSMSHELRTPLNAIINFVHMISKGLIGPVNQEQEELLNLTLNSSKHLLHLINDVLDISKIQAGQLTLFLEDNVNVLEEAGAVIDIVKGLADEKSLQLITDMELDIPLIACDRRRVRQILLNLMGNAIKFTETGTVTLKLKKHGQKLLFAVMDTGPGIPVTEQELIFAPFMQADEGVKVGQGTGLGLPISRSLVQAHGGDLWVESKRGEGAAFFFTIPMDGRDTNHAD